VGDEALAVAENRRRVMTELELPAEPLWLAQVHGATVVEADALALCMPAAPAPQGDAALTRRPGRVLAVLVADCLPVLLARRDGAAVAVAHAGWRGLAAGVLEATVAALDGAGDELLAWLGPAIGPAHYRSRRGGAHGAVSARLEAAAAFAANARGRWQCDLQRLARQRLAALGVRFDPCRGALHLRAARVVLFVPPRRRHRAHGGVDLARGDARERGCRLPAMTLAWISLATFFGGALSAALASLFLLLSEARRNWLLPHLISFATGAMLAAALIGLLPEAIASVGPARIQGIGAAVLAGIALFFVLEKLVLWRHCHAEGCETHSPHESDRDRAAGWIVLFGDGVHNAFDGVLIAAAFLTDTRLGVVTTIAITAHEIPQELGDLAVLLHARMSPVRALWFNAASSLTSILGGPGGFFCAAADAGHAAVCDLGGGRFPDLRRSRRPDSGAAPARGPGRRRRAGAADRLRGRRDRRRGAVAGLTGGAPAPRRLRRCA
jgi:zinc and cadmium transporter